MAADPPANNPPAWMKRWEFYLSIPAVIVALLTIWHFYHPDAVPPTNVNVSPIVIPPSTPTDLSISSADLHVWNEREYLWHIIPGRAVSWYVLDIFLVNQPQKPLTDCYVAYDYKLADGGYGKGTAWAGAWNEFWFDKKPTPLSFALSGDKNFKQQFFFEGPEHKPDWIKLRTACEKPSLAASSEYYVDLAHSVGWKN
jgi:hypothetical protein